MKNLLFALVFFFPPAVIAEGVAPSIVLKLPYGLETRRNVLPPEEKVPAGELSWLQKNCCIPVEEKPDRSVFSHQKRNWLRHLRETQRIQMSIFDWEASLSSRQAEQGAWHLGKVGKHGRVYGIEYRRTAGILDGSPGSLNFLVQWFLPQETQ